MTPEQLAQLRELLRDVRHWRTGIDEALDAVNALVGGVDAPPPDSTGTPLPVPTPDAIHEAVDHLRAAEDLLEGSGGPSQ